MCTGDPSIEFTSQSEVFENIEKYEEPLLGIQTGALLVVLCALMWLITGAYVCKYSPLMDTECTNTCMHAVINDMTSCVRMTSAVTSLRGATTKIVGNKIVSISNARLAFFWTAMAVRFAVAVALGYGMHARAHLLTPIRDPAGRRYSLSHEYHPARRDHSQFCRTGRAIA